jgi:DNA-binding NtrC family response regulator
MPTNNNIVSIVEDEPDIKTLFYEVLSDALNGFSVVKFCDSVIALEHFRNNKENYILVIADWKMPKLDGVELLSRIKKLNPQVRSMLISAYEIENHPNFQRYIEEGIIDKFIQKPVAMDYLCQEVNKQIQA